MLMRMEREERVIIEKAKEIEKLINELVEKISWEGRGVEILSMGLRKTIISVLSHLTQCNPSFQVEVNRKYLQKSLSLLQSLEYYTYVSRKVGFISSSPHLRLREMIKDLKKHLFHSEKKLMFKEYEEMKNILEYEGTRTRPGPSLRAPGTEGEKLLLS